MRGDLETTVKGDDQNRSLPIRYESMVLTLDDDDAESSLSISESLLDGGTKVEWACYEVVVRDEAGGEHRERRRNVELTPTQTGNLRRPPPRPLHSDRSTHTAPWGDKRTGRDIAASSR